MDANIGKAWAFIRGHGVGIGREILINFAAPYLIYDLAKPRWGEVGGLIASSAPPILWSIFEFVRRRRVDAVSILAMAGIALSLLAFLGGGSVRMLQMREKLVTGLIGLAFLGSAAIGKPLIYQLARANMMRRSASDAASFEAMRDNVYFRRVMMTMTLVWGLGLIVECVVSGLLVFVVSVRDYLLVGPVVGYGTMGALGLWTFWYSREQRRKGEQRRARAEAEASDTGASAAV